MRSIKCGVYGSHYGLKTRYAMQVNLRVFMLYTLIAVYYLRCMVVPYNTPFHVDGIVMDLHT